MGLRFRDSLHNWWTNNNAPHGGGQEIPVFVIFGLALWKLVEVVVNLAQKLVQIAKDLL